MHAGDSLSFEVVAAWVSEPYRSLHLSVAMYRCLALSLPAQWDYIMSDILKSSLTR
jgi:hypothetical protein